MYVVGEEDIAKKYVSQFIEQFKSDSQLYLRLNFSEDEVEKYKRLKSLREFDLHTVKTILGLKSFNSVCDICSKLSERFIRTEESRVCFNCVNEMKGLVDNADTRKKDKTDSV